MRRYLVELEIHEVLRDLPDEAVTELLEHLRRAYPEIAGAEAREAKREAARAAWEELEPISDEDAQAFLEASREIRGYVTSD